VICQPVEASPVMVSPALANAAIVIPTHLFAASECSLSHGKYFDRLSRLIAHVASTAIPA